VDGGKREFGSDRGIWSVETRSTTRRKRKDVERRAYGGREGLVG